MGALVMFMQCGFAFLEAGAVRSKVNGINYFSSVFQNLRVVVSTKVHIVGPLTISSSTTRTMLEKSWEQNPKTELWSGFWSQDLAYIPFLLIFIGICQHAPFIHWKERC